MKERALGKQIWLACLGVNLAVSLVLGGCGAEPSFSAKAGKQTPVVKEVTFAVVGDIMVHDYQYEEAYDPVTQTYDFSHNFQNVKKYFDGYDFVVGNLETVFGGGSPSSYPVFSTPDSFLDAVKDAGFNVLTTANNHSMDGGEKGVLRTLDLLDEKGIAHTGTYRSQEERDKCFILEKNGISVAFVAATYGTNGISVPKDYLVNRIDHENFLKDIAKAQKEADFVVVLPHMGIEYERAPRADVEHWVDEMFAQGADLVLGSHPHVLQPMEYRTLDHGEGKHDGFLIYSLGNFISSQTTPPRNASVILHITVKQIGDAAPTVSAVSFVPIWTQFRNAANVNHFMVQSVEEMLTLPEETKYQVIRPKDEKRLREIHEETASFLLQRDVPLEEIKEEYDFPLS